MSPQSPVRLLPLICPACQTPILAKVDERAWVCATCQKGYLLMVDGSLRAQDIFFSSAIKPGTPGRPFWVAPGQVTISERTTYGGDRGKEAQDFWAAQRLFYIPAFETALEDIISAGVSMLRSPIQVQPGPPAPFLPVVTPPEDLRPLAEFIVYSLEADRKDALKTLKFSLRLENPQLWMI